MDVHFSDDVEEYAAATLPFLGSDPVRATVLLTVTEAIRTGIAQTTDPRFSWVTAGNTVVASALTGTAGELLLSPAPDAAAVALAKAWAASAYPVEGVTGPRPAARCCADGIAARRGRALQERFPERLFRLDAVAPPRQPPGHARLANAADVDLAVDWFAAFATEAGVGSLPDPRRGVTTRLAADRLWMWDDGGPVSMVSRSPSVCGVSRIGPVYTPGEHRGRGYARALVAVVSQACLDGGDMACCLFTDLTNPVSNAIYQEIGYRGVEDFAQYALV